MDYAQQIIQCYEHLSSSTNVEQASKFLVEFYNERKAFAVLISILNSDQNETIKQHAALGLKKTLKNRLGREDSEDKEEFYKPIFFLLMTNNSVLVSKLLIQIITETDDDLVYEMIISFASQAVSDDEEGNDPSFNYPMAVYSSLCLLDACMESIGIKENTMPVYQKVISAGFQVNKTPTQIAAISCTFHLTFICDNDLGYGPVFPQSLALMQSLTRSSHIYELFNIFHVMMDHSCPLINPHLLIPQILNIINSEENDFEVRRHAFLILIDTIRNYSDELFPSEEDQSSDKQNSNIISNNINNYANYIFEATVAIVSSSFNEDESYDMSPYDLIEPIAEQFAAFDDLLDSFWEQIEEMQQYPFGQFLSIVFIRSSLDDGYDFYLPKIVDIASLFCGIVSESQSSCLKEAGILALCSFAKTFVEDITELKSTIQDTVFTAVTSEPSTEMFNAFEELISSIEDSDNIFGKSCEFFSNIISSDQANMQLKEQALWCISEVIKNSKTQVEPNFQDLFNLSKEISEIDAKNDMSQNGLKSAGIYCLSHLCKKCPTLFEPFAEEFAKCIVANVSELVSSLSEEQQDSELNIDESIIIQSIGAYWYIVENIQESANSTMEEMVNLLIQICDTNDQRIKSQKRISNMIGSISIQDIALRVLCGCAATYPVILQSIIQQLLSFIVANPSKSSAIATNWIASSITSLSNRAEVVPQLVSILIEMIDTSVDIKQTEKCFESLAILIDWCGAVVLDERKVLQMAGKALTNELHCFNKDNEKSRIDVYGEAQEVFIQAIKALQKTAYQTLQTTEFKTMQNISFIELFIRIVESESKSIRDLGLQLFGELIGETPEGQIPTQLLEHILEIAAKEINDENSWGYFAIKKLACSSPFNSSNAEDFKSLIPKMVQTLFNNSPYAPEINPSHKVESTMMANDNCVNALGAILMNIFGENLIESFNIFEVDEDLKVPVLLVILSAMPPKIDFAENESIMEFYFWLFEKANGNFVEQFTAVLVKIFTEPIETLKEKNLLEEPTIQKLRKMLVELVPRSGGEQFCSTILDADEDKLMILNSYLTEE